MQWGYQAGLGGGRWSMLYLSTFPTFKIRSAGQNHTPAAGGIPLAFTMSPPTQGGR